MVDFRNKVVHDYQEINLVILQQVIEIHLLDIIEYTKTIILH
ncbi:HepT-like ribonuclease domain-containing protein [Metabacillus fastidiosus]